MEFEGARGLKHSIIKIWARLTVAELWFWFFRRLFVNRIDALILFLSFAV